MAATATAPGAMDDWSPSDSETLPEDLVLLVKPELQPGERLLWASRPEASKDIAEWPSKAALTWFLGFLTIGVSCGLAIPFVGGFRQLKPDVAAILAVIAVIAGVIAFTMMVGFLSTSFSTSAQRRKLAGHVYALTDRRAVIWVPMPKSAVSVHTYQRGTIRGEELSRIQYPDGSGDVLFHGHSFGNAPGFFGIADVRVVEEMVRRFLVDPSVRPAPRDEYDYQ